MRNILILLLIGPFSVQSPTETDDPLKEDAHRVLLTLEGEAAGDQFGWVARRLPDADGDGWDDFCTSAPYRNEGGANAGKVYAYSGKTGALLFEASGAPGDLLGIGVESAGDVNGDGAGDVVAGGTGVAEGLGGVFVYSGRDGEILLEAFGDEPGGWFGRKAAGTGDVDRDGHDDLLVGAPLEDGNGTDSGALYVLSGVDGALLCKLDGKPGEKLGNCVDGYTSDAETRIIVGAPNAGEGKTGGVYGYRYADGVLEATWSFAGAEDDVNLARMFLSFVGDVDGDGALDVYASDWESNAGGVKGAGRIYVLSGDTGELLWKKAGEAAGDGFGIGTAEAGDVDGDGRADLIVGAWQNDEGAQGAGKCYLMRGATGEVIDTYTWTVAGDTFGFDATGIGDVDRDGALDFLITAAYSAVKGPQTGRVFVLAGPKLKTRAVRTETK